MLISFPVTVTNQSRDPVYGVSIKYTVESLIFDPVTGRFRLPETVLPLQPGESYRTSIDIPEHRIGKRAMADHFAAVEVVGVQTSR